jgi:tetratricopeptide (TPR) repeat protein
MKNIWAHKNTRICVFIGMATIIMFCMIFSSIQVTSESKTDIDIKTSNDCGSNAQFSLGGNVTIFYQLTEAAPDSEYEYWVTDYADSGRILGNWKGYFETDNAGNASSEYILRAALPVGQHSVQLKVPELGLVKRCEYSVEGETLIPKKDPSDPDCYYEELEITIDLDKTAVTPGDTAVITVTVDNTMKCDYIIEANSLLIDLGELGGIIYPLKVDTKMDAGKKASFTHEFTVPEGASGYYPVNMVYDAITINEQSGLIPGAFNESYCTWAASTLLWVGAAGTISVVSTPDTLRIEEEGSIQLEVSNPLPEAEAYTVRIQIPEGITFKDISPENPVYIVNVGPQSSATVPLVISSSLEGNFTILFQLLIEDQVIEDTSVIIPVEEPPNGSLQLVSPPSTMKKNEAVTLELEITNKSRKEYTYFVAATVEGDLDIPETSWEVTIPREGIESLFIPVTAREDTPASIKFALSQNGVPLDSYTWNVTVKRNSIPIILTGAGIACVIAGGIYLKFKGRKPVEQVSEHIKLTEAEEYAKAGESAEADGELQTAAQWYEKAADAFKKIGKIERAIEFYKKAADIWEKLEKIKKAWENREKAADLYQEMGVKAENRNELDKAANYYQKAADIFQEMEKIDNVVKAVELLIRAKDIWNKLYSPEKAHKAETKAASLCEHIGILTQKLKEYSVAANYYEKAADMWRNTGNKEKSGQLCEKVMNVQKHLQDTKGIQKIGVKTAEIYEEAGSKAYQNGEYEKAAEYCKKAGELWKKTGYKAKKDTTYQKTAEIYEEAGLKEYQRGTYEKAGMFYEKAADMWRNIGDESRVKRAEQKAVTAYGKG